MKFKIETPNNCMGYGRLCCTVPDETESEIIFKDFEAFAARKQKKSLVIIMR